MAVDTNFASLFEKLKVEDPWLPPKTWESIPSQSGTAPVPRSKSQVSCSSSVSEASLVRLAVNALHGVESALISIEKLSAAFCSDPADRTFHQIPSLWNRSSSTHALGKILKSIGYSGFLVFLLHKFVDYFMDLNGNGNSVGKRQRNSVVADIPNRCSGEEQEECPPYSLVNQAFSVAVGKLLEGFVCALDTLYASVGLRRSHKSIEMPFSASSGCLTSVVQSEITLLELYLHTKELRTQIEALGSICSLHNIALRFSISPFEELAAQAAFDFCKFYRGGDLLSYLYAQLKVADPSHSALLKFLFLQSCEPYCGFIRSWIFKAEIHDPYKEFVVEYVNKSQKHGKAGISMDFPLASIRVRDGATIPCFLKDFLIPLVRAGQQLQAIMKLLELHKCATPGDYSYMDILPCWTGFLGNDPNYASPITFSKGNMEALVLIRNSYYERMQEKLQNLWSKLEFSYDEVISDGATEPIFSGSGGDALNTMTSFTADDKLALPLTVYLKRSNVDVNYIDFDDSSTKDESSPIMDVSDTSDCSSISSVEEQSESKQLIESHNCLVGSKDNYFSALSFSTSTSIDNSLQKPLLSEKSCHMEVDSQKIYERIDIHGHFMDSQCNGLVFSHSSVPFGSDKLNWPFGNVQYIDSLPGKSWPLGGLLKNPFRVDVTYKNHKRLHSSVPSLKMGKGHGEVSNGCMSYFSNLDASEDVSTAANSCRDQVVKDFSSDRFVLQHWKSNYSGNFLSRNLMLAKSSLFCLMPGNACSIPCGQWLPFFDFSSVDDPCKIFIEKLTASFRHKPFGKTSSILTLSNNNQHGKQSCEGHTFLFENSEVSEAHLPLGLNSQNQDSVMSTSVSGGSSWESLLGSSSVSDNGKAVDDKHNLSAVFEIPLDFIIDKCLLQEISLQYNYVSKLTIKLLEEGFDLQEHLLALRRYHFMELADWADLFIMSLWRHKWCVTEADQRLSEIQGLLELSVQRSSCEKDHNKNRLFVYMKGHGMMPLSTSAVGVHSFDFLGLGYRVDWPVSIILTPAALKIYADIFSFLIQVKLANFSLADVWCSLKDVMHLISKKHSSAVHERQVGRFNVLMKLRHQVNHFVSTLQQYVQSQLSHISWCRFLHSFKHKVKDMMDLQSVHMAYLTDSLHICFLSDETRQIAGIIENILQCALDFRSCLIRGLWDRGLEEGDLLDKLSRINIAQVLAIKQKFDKNLKELHLCYLRSPKHGETGLSCFWEHLNYNDYYSDGHEMGHYAFSV